MRRNAIMLPLEQTCRLFEGLQDHEIGKIVSAVMEWHRCGALPLLDFPLNTLAEELKFYICHPRRLWMLESKSQAAKRDRSCKEYAEWRIAVFMRDGFKCQACGQVGGTLNAHHIKEFSKYPALRFDVDNGITLCKDCHKKVHRGGRDAE